MPRDHGRQTDEYVATSATFFNMSDGKDPDELATPVIEYVETAPVVTDITCLLEPPVLPVLMDYVAPAPAVACDEPAPAIEYMRPVPVPVTEYVTTILTEVYAAPAHVIERVAPSPVIDYIASPSAESGVFVNLQFSIFAVEASASQGVVSIPSSIERVQQHTVEQIVHVPRPQTQEHFRQCTVEQVADSPVLQIVEEVSEVMRLRTTEQIAQELLLGSVAALDWLQGSAITLDQRIAEHQLRIQEDRLPEQVAEQIQDAPAKEQKKGRHKK